MENTLPFCKILRIPGFFLSVENGKEIGQDFWVNVWG
jgi:hypothetical protein